jgi:hypothetical protein
MALFLLVILIAIALGILGEVLNGLFFLLIIGVVIFAADLLFGGLLLGRHRAGRPAR